MRLVIAAPFRQEWTRLPSLGEFFQIWAGDGGHHVWMGEGSPGDAGGTKEKKDLTNQDRTSDLEMIIQLQSHALPTELW